MYDIATLMKGHKDKMRFSLKQKVIGRERPWHLEGANKQTKGDKEKTSPLVI